MDQKLSVWHENRLNFCKLKWERAGEDSRLRGEFRQSGSSEEEDTGKVL